MILRTTFLETPLGPMMAVGDETFLYVLAFAGQRGLGAIMQKLTLQTKAVFKKGMTKPIQFIKTELSAYFDGFLREFQTPLCLLGTPFQKKAWQQLLQVSYGQTNSYQQQAQYIGHPHAHRAVANANGSNPVVIAMPCHRIVRHSGALGGYGGGILLKQWLLDHEQSHLPC